MCFLHKFSGSIIDEPSSISPTTSSCDLGPLLGGFLDYTGCYNDSIFTGITDCDCGSRSAADANCQLTLYQSTIGQCSLCNVPFNSNGGTTGQTLIARGKLSMAGASPSPLAASSSSSSAIPLPASSSTSSAASPSLSICRFGPLTNSTEQS